MTPTALPSRLHLDASALVHNWRWCAQASGGAACGAAVKADGYGLGAVGVARRLAEAGCRDFFVASWAEAQALMPLGDGLSLTVLHGLREADIAAARAMPGVRAVLNSAEQVARGRHWFADRPCDVMIDTGINRLGIRHDGLAEADLSGLIIDTVLSHLACADEDSAMNARQLERFAAAASVPARRRSLANSAGICLGPDYRFDLTRPGLALYGGIPRGEADGHIRPVVFPAAEVIQLKRVRAGETVGYGATFAAPTELSLAVVNLGYADGYLRALGGAGTATINGVPARIAGRVSMDLIALAVEDGGDGHVHEGDWARFDFDLPGLSAASGLTQYELLTSLGARYRRDWRAD